MKWKWRISCAVKEEASYQVNERREALDWHVVLLRILRALEVQQGPGEAAAGIVLLAEVANAPSVRLDLVHVIASQVRRKEVKEKSDGGKKK